MLGCNRVCSWWKMTGGPGGWLGKKGGEVSLWVLAMVLSLLLFLSLSLKKTNVCCGCLLCLLVCLFSWDSIAKQKKGSRTGVEGGVLCKDNLIVDWAFMRKLVNTGHDIREKSVGNHFHHHWHNDDFKKKIPNKFPETGRWWGETLFFSLACSGVLCWIGKSLLACFLMEKKEKLLSLVF